MPALQPIGWSCSTASYFFNTTAISNTRPISLSTKQAGALAADPGNARLAARLSEQWRGFRWAGQPGGAGPMLRGSAAVLLPLAVLLPPGLSYI